MNEAVYDGSLTGLFGLLEGVFRGAAPPDRVRRVLPEGSPAPEGAPFQPDLFGPAPGNTGPDHARFFGEGGHFHPMAAELARLSIDAYDDFLQGWMSELPIETELVRFARRVFAAAREAGPPGFPRERQAVEQARNDRGDPAVLTVLEAAARVRHEIHRMLGFLRFSPDAQGRYAARCAPDHFVLPALASHFLRRFGPVPWAIIDEKRNLSLVRPAGGEPQLLAGIAAEPGGPSSGPDPWEELWRGYHRSINNESRKNPGLQRQCMPLRYWKYLPEMA